MHSHAKVGSETLALFGPFNLGSYPTSAKPNAQPKTPQACEQSVLSTANRAHEQNNGNYRRYVSEYCTKQVPLYAGLRRV